MNVGRFLFGRVQCGQRLLFLSFGRQCATESSQEIEDRSISGEVPEYFNFMTDVIDKHAAEEIKNKSPRLAFWWVDEVGNEIKWSFSRLSKYTRRLSSILNTNCGLGSQDRVVAVLPRIPEWWLLNLACMRIGAVLSPGTTLLTPRDLRYRINAAQATCVIADVANAEKVDQIISDCPHVKSRLLISNKTITRPKWMNYRHLFHQACDIHDDPVQTRSSDLMQLFFTSGTTGSPKMIRHTHASCGLGHHGTASWLDLEPSDIMWCLTDTGWAKAAYSTIFAPWLRGSCVFVHSLAKFDPLITLQVLQNYPISVFCAPPTAYRFMIREKDQSRFNFPALRHCVSAGEPLNAEVSSIWNQLTGHTIREGYGQTETTLLCCTLPHMDNKPGSMGKPAPGYDIRIVDDDGEELGDNVEGNIAIKIKPNRPVGLFAGYLGVSDEQAAASFVGDYYLTGDRAYRDSDGFLWFVTRSDDIIISAGYRIGPFEVESALIEHPAVLESAVVSSPCSERGEIVKAFVVLREGVLAPSNSISSTTTSSHGIATTDDSSNGASPAATALIKELQDHCKSVTAPYKYPRKIEFVSELPKTISGKIRRIELRQREWNSSSDDSFDQQQDVVSQSDEEIHESLGGQG